MAAQDPPGPTTTDLIPPAILKFTQQGRVLWENYGCGCWSIHFAAGKIFLTCLEHEQVLTKILNPITAKEEKSE